jgi:hypothetical protein
MFTNVILRAAVVIMGMRLIVTLHMGDVLRGCRWYYKLLEELEDKEGGFAGPFEKTWIIKVLKYLCHFAFGSTK